MKISTGERFVAVARSNRYSTLRAVILAHLACGFWWLRGHTIQCIVHLVLLQCCGHSRFLGRGTLGINLSPHGIPVAGTFFCPEFAQSLPRVRPELAVSLLFGRLVGK